MWRRDENKTYDNAFEEASRMGKPSAAGNEINYLSIGLSIRDYEMT
jgi:hypothetical protein